MGRSVLTHPDARATVNDNWDDGVVESYLEMLREETPDATEEDAYARIDWDFEWESYRDRGVEAFIEAFPSLEADDVWESYPLDEVHIVAGNAHTVLALSQYGAVAAWSLIPRADLRRSEGQDDAMRGLSIRWIESVTDRFERVEAYASPMRVLGRFSDGTTAYVKVPA